MSKLKTKNTTRAAVNTTKSAVSIRYLILVVSAAIILMPVYVLFVTAFKPNTEAMPGQTWMLPQTWTLDNWVDAWRNLAPAVGRTLIMVTIASLFSSFLGSMNGFVLSRWRFPGANVVFTFLLFGMFIPYQAVMIPLISLMKDIAVPSGIATLIVLHVIYGIPITTLIFRNYYESVPEDLIEAAKMDGAGMFRTYTRVVLPLSVPSFVVVIIWQFTSAWNDFLFALFFTQPGNGPVTYALQAFAKSSLITANNGGAMAGALIASVPTLIVYIALGRYFVSGLMSGSVKG